MNIELIETGRDGALTEYRVTNAAHLKEDFYTDMVRVEGNDLTGRCSKADLRKIRSWIERQNAPEAAARATAGAENTRRVLIPFGAVSVGDEIAGRTVRGLGRDFYPNADQFSQWGISPDYAGTVQYAYFEEN